MDSKENTSDNAVDSRVSNLERLYKEAKASNREKELEISGLKSKVKSFDDAAIISKAKSNFIAQGGKADLFEQFNQASPKFSEQNKKEVEATKNLFNNFFNAPVVKVMDTSGESAKTENASEQAPSFFDEKF